jgi:hypothetical protein
LRSEFREGETARVDARDDLDPGQSSVCLGDVLIREHLFVLRKYSRTLVVF